MADYIYLLETRLAKQQQEALTLVRGIARDHDLTVFLVGGAIRDLISGAPVRDLDVAVQGNALRLKKDLEKHGGEFSGENTPMQQLHFRFPGGARIEVGSTLSASYPKPGRIVVKPTTILDDLRRRDFTANAMALSLNEGSYGLLMDPLNGVADIENRELRLVSNYGFIEDPIRLIRAARFMARMGWHLDEKSQTRYETAKVENYIAAMQPADRAYELEELFHEEDPLRVMHRLEEEGWLAQLSPVLATAKANAPELNRLKDTQSLLYEQGVLADAAAANFPLLTAKLAAKDVQMLKESFPRKGFVREIEGLEAAAKEFATQLAGKQTATPSQAFRLISGAVPVVALWTAFSSKNATVQAKFKSFYSEWPQNRQRLPYLLMQEMRITPELPDYDDLLQKIFFGLMDGQLETPEAMRGFLEPYSPPAPPPPVSLRRPRAAKAAKKEGRSAKPRKKAEDLQPVDPADLPAEPTAAPDADRGTQPPSPSLDGESPAAVRPATAPHPSPAKSVPAKPGPTTQKAKPAKPSAAPAKAVAAPAKSSAPAAKTNAPAKKSVAPSGRESKVRSAPKAERSSSASPASSKKSAPPPRGSSGKAGSSPPRSAKAAKAGGGRSARATPAHKAAAPAKPGKRRPPSKPQGAAFRKTSGAASRAKKKAAAPKRGKGRR